MCKPRRQCPKLKLSMATVTFRGHSVRYTPARPILVLLRDLRMFPNRNYLVPLAVLLVRPAYLVVAPRSVLVLARDDLSRWSSARLVHRGTYVAMLMSNLQGRR